MAYSGKFGRAGGNGRGNGLRSFTGVSNPVYESTKSVSYNATESDQIYSIKSAISSQGDSYSAMPSLVEVQNTGTAPLLIMMGYANWTSETAVTEASAGTFAAADIRYLHIMLMPGEVYSPAIRAVLTSGGAITDIMDGTAVDNLAPDSNEYTDSTAKTTEGFADDDDTTITFDDASGGVAHSMFRVNDLIRLDNEVCRIKSIVDTDGDGAYTPAHFIVDRAVHGTDKADHTNNTAIRFPFFNAYHDFDKYTVAQTDNNGKFKCSNFFGQGRSTSGVQGILPGSVAIKFYTEGGYQSLGLSGITSSTETSLEASGSYWFKIAIDGGTAESINFTVDSSNTNWGGTSGVTSKINTALNDKYNNSASNTFQKRSSVGIVDGDIRFTSGSNLSTSAIALTAGVDGASATYNLFAQQNGHIPALANVPDAIPIRLPDDVTYDPITYRTYTNSNAFCYDNGNGGLIGKARGSINYETGAIDITGAPANSEFVVSCLHSSAFSGKLNEGTGKRTNSLVEILANTTSQKGSGSVSIKTY